MMKSSTYNLDSTISYFTMPFYFLTSHNFEVEIYSEHVEASTLFNSNSSDECSCFFEKAISYYFPLSQCIKGLKVLVQSLFGVTFHSIPLAPGESWHEDVLKMSVHHPEEVLCMGLPVSEDIC